MSISSVSDLLILHEELKLKPYTDTVGKLTIGIGRNLTDDGITHNEALYLFNDDLIATEAALLKQLPWTSWLDVVRKAVLTDMCFNMGIERLLSFKDTLALIEQKKYDCAAKEMLDSKWATQVGTRAVRLSKMMDTGEWPSV